MTKMRIRLIVVLMSIALVGLAGFQLYWIKNAIHQNELQFDSRVKMALKETALKTQQFELSHFAMNRFSPFPMSSPADTGVSYRGFSKQFSFSYNVGTGRDAINSHPMQIMEERRKMFQNLMNELFGEKAKSIEQRIPKIILDSILQAELEQVGIKQPVVFGVLDRSIDTIKYCDSKKYLAHVRSSPYKAQLFPHDFSQNEFYLSVSFPHYARYLFKDMFWMFFASVILIGLIIFCFVYVIIGIMRQKKLSEVKNDFINNMTHELKTPISTISLACQALKDPEVAGKTDFASRYISIVDEENHRLERQVERVLQLAARDNEEQKLSISKVDFHKIINETVKQFSLRIEENKGSIDLNLNAAEPFLDGDADHLSGILQNLIDNAIKYNKNKPHIEITTSRLGSKFVLKVKDNGIGMSTSVQKDIFEKFYRAKTGNVHDVKGFGLGLSYVKNIVDRHNGEIKVKSEQGKGSVFTIALPYKHEK